MTKGNAAVCSGNSCFKTDIRGSGTAVSKTRKIGPSGIKKMWPWRQDVLRRAVEFTGTY